MRKILQTLIFVIVAVASVQASEITINKVYQHGEDVKIDYTLTSDTPSTKYYLTLYYNQNNGAWQQCDTGIEGNLNGVAAGRNTITFQPLKAGIELYGDNFRFKIVADKFEKIDGMVYVEGGTFQMGSGSSAHSVTLSSYYIGKYEVTQAQWIAIMGSNPSYFKGDNLPVEQVSWNDCQEFIRKLNAKTGKRYRLPTEAEWEYAARGGNKSRGYEYSGSNTLSSVGWNWNNSGNRVTTGNWDKYEKVEKINCRTHSIGEKQPNELGIYDMSGNVWEWCSDWYGSYSSSSQTNPTGASTGSFRVYRGGSWLNDAWSCRVANSFSSSPGYRFNYLGLRLVLVP